MLCTDKGTVLSWDYEGDNTPYNSLTCHLPLDDGDWVYPKTSVCVKQRENAHAPPATHIDMIMEYKQCCRGIHYMIGIFNL